MTVRPARPAGDDAQWHGVKRRPAAGTGHVLCRGAVLCLRRSPRTPRGAPDPPQHNTLLFPPPPLTAVRMLSSTDLQLMLRSLYAEYDAPWLHMVSLVHVLSDSEDTAELRKALRELLQLLNDVQQGEARAQSKCTHAHMEGPWAEAGACGAAQSRYG
jgi:hypothetical protein